MNLSAQYGDQLVNRGFEDWTTRVNEPVHWHSGGTATGTWSSLMPNTMEQSGHYRPGSSGSKSIRLVPGSVVGVTANGSCTNGRINAGSMSASGTNNYNYTQRSQSAYNTPITMRPDSIAVWICFRSQSSTDQGFVKAVVHGNTDYQIIANGTESPTNMRVSEAYIEFTRTSTANGSYNWRRLSIPFEPGSHNDPRYILFVATTNKTAGSGSTNDDLFLDDVLLIYNPTLTMGNLASTSYAPGDAVTIPFTLTGTMSPENLNAAANVVIAQLSDANGSFSNPTELGRVTTNTSGSITAQIPSVANGQYTIRVISTNYPMIGESPKQVTIANPTYTIDVNANPSAGGTVSGGGEYTLGQSCTVAATANAGYSFTNWTEGGNAVSTNASYTFNVTSNRTLVGNFAINTYSISATANPTAGGTVSGSGEYNHGASCTLTATANTGYTFVNWTKNGAQVSTNANYTFTVTEAGEYVAHFSQNTFAITATANPTAGGTVNGAGNYTYGASCTLTATANTGYTFVKWMKNGTQVSTNASYTFTVTEAGEYVAHFSQNSYAITASADPAAGGSVSGAGNYNHGASCTLTATANTGYSFVNWTKNGTQVSTNASYTFTVTEAGEYVAHFSQNTFAITATANPTAGGTVNGAGNYTYGASCTLTATANTGYTFVKWMKNGTQVSTNASYTFTVTEAGEYVAHFSQNSYAITASADPTAGGSVNGAGEYNHGASCTLTATANTGYTFVNWTKNGTQVSTNASYTFTVTAAGEYVAHFSQNIYTITVSADPTAGGTVSGGGSFTHGESCTLTATANTGYTFVKWMKNGTQVSTDASYTFTVTEAGEYVAYFSQNSYPITATANPSVGGIVNGAGNYNHGASCTLTATANTGYSFVNWTKNGSQVSTDASYTFTVIEAGNFLANFSLNSYNITVTANPSDGGTVGGDGSFNYGESCTVTATASTGYTFTNWTENGLEVSTNPSYTFTVDGDRNLVANFSAISYTIEVSANPSNSGTATGGGNYNYGQSCTVIATSADGYVFSNWTENGDVVSTDANYTFTVDGDRSLVANFEELAPDTYSINVSPNPNVGGTVTGGGIYQQDEQCTVTATANAGYTFLKWTENGNQVSTSASYTFTVTGNRTLVAQFQIQSYTINATVNPGNSGTVTGGGNFDYGQTCTLVATANTGYTFTNWTENGNVVSTSYNYSFTVNGNRNLVANFTLNSYHITATSNPSVGGAISGIGDYNYGDSCTLTAIPNESYIFVQWTENGEQVSTEASYTFTVTSNRTLVAEFQIQSCTISATVNPSDGGVVTGAGDYDYGQTCTLIATANEGYTFINWTEDGNVVSMNTNYIFTVNGSRELIANFSTNAYTITVTATPIEGGTVTGEGNYEYGTTCTLTATANYEYTFVKWTKNGEEVSTEATFTFTVTASEDYVAHFDGPDAIEEGTIECQIFPNPFTSKVNIKAGKTLKTVSVYDIYGRLLKEQKVSDMEIELDMSGLSNGAYLLKLDYGDSSSVHHIVKIRK